MSAPTAHRLEQNRLSDEDRAAIGDRIGEIVDLWRQASPAGRVPTDPSSVLALIRAGGHAIGCTWRSLRESELAEIERIALDAIRRSNDL